MEGSAVVCAVMSGVALKQMGGFQLKYMEGTLHFLSVNVHSLSLVDFKLLSPNLKAKPCSIICKWT